jgi:hypothetical protein
MAAIGYLLWGTLFGYLGFREARNFARQNGRSPWGWDPVVWGLVVFFTGLLIGGVLLLIARRSTQRQLRAVPPAMPAPNAWPAQPVPNAWAAQPVGWGAAAPAPVAPHPAAPHPAAPQPQQAAESPWAPPAAASPNILPG